MDTLSTLKFVRGAVSTKNLLPELKHFTIRDGTVCGFNGDMALSAPIDFAVDCAPKAIPMMQAIGNCGDVTGLAITESGKLRIVSGKFKAFIECEDIRNMPLQQPTGEVIAFDGAAMMAAIAKLTPFVGSDAVHMWANGILLRGKSAFATNNVCLAEYWIGSEIPFTVNIPMTAIKEMTRIGVPPTHAQLDENSMTFHYTGGAWLRTTLYETKWPDVSSVLDKPGNPVAVPAGLWEALAAVKPFVEENNRVYFRDGAVCTSTRDGIGASYNVEGLHTEGIFNIKMLSLLNGAAERIDFEAYPKPLLFYGDRIRGAILGQKA